MAKYRLLFCLLILTGVSFYVLWSIYGCKPSTPIHPYRYENYWKDQALKDIIPYWSKFAIDHEHGAFYTNLDAHWQSFGDSSKYPSMISRHLFAYSVAYLLSGNDQYLKVAEDTKKYLLSKAWDKEYGGWYDLLNVSGEPLQTSKSMFVQVYTITGLTLYYFITHDPEVLDYIERSNTLLESKGWDSLSAGYYSVFNRDWTIKDSTKSFSSVVPPVSGHLLYLYLATRQETYLNQAVRIMNTVQNKMRDPDSGWVLESFTPDWKYINPHSNENEINIGHNIEAAWMWLRLNLIKENARYGQAAIALADQLHRLAYKPASGIWPNALANDSSGQYTPYTYWWIQAYGLMFDLTLFKTTRSESFLNSFDQGAQLWDSGFVDKINGDTHFALWEDGRIKEDIKAGPYKASYHNMEHALLNHLYAALWVNCHPVILHFNIVKSKEGDLLYPLPIEGDEYKITKVWIDDKPYPVDPGNNLYIRLPSLNNARIKVKLQSGKSD